ncbi:MAG: CDP-glucose 4,6-dehydratase [Candidatus Ancillula sp.]|jgi:CDP-glucose 4,6-dehydratase|nr:CDP-glucose 4,6-dehydratase [Candidatus Ancillula sp.]
MEELEGTVGGLEKKVGKMHYLVTGHTGFKGAWLCLMLLEQGHKVSGISLEPYELPALEGVAEERQITKGVYELAQVGQRIEESGGQDVILDIRDHTALEAKFAELQPDVVMHLAAQALVLEGYRDPRTTIESNVMGTFNVMQASEKAGSVKAQLIITTDKVYKNVDKREGYREDEELGMNPDPYSSSKAAADIIAQVMIVHPDSKVPTAISRGGNVIGGGDVCQDRLFVDLLRDAAAGRETVIRYPESTRPWQHVLDCDATYISIVQALLDGVPNVAGEAFNAAPKKTDFIEVSTIADLVVDCWNNTEPKLGVEAQGWKTVDKEFWHEAHLLALDPSKVEQVLGWKGILDWKEATQWSVNWTKRVLAGQDAGDVCMDEIREYNRLKG